MSQYSFENNQLILKVKKSPLFIRIALFTITVLCFLLPLFGLVFNAIAGNGLKFTGILFLGIFSLIGFYMLRVSLWNHFGQETFEFTNTQIIYFADYGWFKDGKKTLKNEVYLYSIKSIGYEDENNGVLVISNGKSKLESVVKIPKQNIERLIDELETAANTR